MTDAKTGEQVRLSFDNWLGLIVLVGGVIGAIVYQTNEMAKVAAIVDQHESRIQRIESSLDRR